MPAQCVKCKQPLAEDKAAKCSACGQLFHTACIKGGDRKYQRLVKDKISFYCDPCKDEMESNVSRSDSEANEDKILRAIAKMDAKMDKQFSDVHSSIANLSSEFSQLSASVESLKIENANFKVEVQELRDENASLHAELQEVKSKSLHLEQYSRVNNVEIRGVPVTEEENVYQLLSCVARALGIAYVNDSISIAHRLQKTAKFPNPSIIVCFISRRERDIWLSAARKMKGISASTIYRSFPNTKVSIIEHLSIHNRTLLGRSRDLVKAKKLASSWVVNGKVMARKEEGGRAVWLHTEDDLDKLVA